MKMLPSRRTITIGGRDVAEIPPWRSGGNRLRAQDGFLFNESLKENIDFFYGASLTEIERRRGWRAWRGTSPHARGTGRYAASGAHHLSGGQAPAGVPGPGACARSQVLLLTSPSAVDAHTEGEILSALSGELRDKSAVIIAHRSPQ
jgi:ATP-binding cassette subfamily B protein